MEKTLIVVDYNYHLGYLGGLRMQIKHTITPNEYIEYKTKKKIEQPSLLCSHYQKIIINIKYVHNITINYRPLFYKNTKFEHFYH